MSEAPKEYRQVSFTRPAGATEILLVRHGESRAATEAEPFPLVDGHGDPELHPNGHEQAKRVAARLRHEPISAIYVTNLRRTSETAAPLSNALGLTPLVEPDLREVHLGEWEGGLLRIKAHQNDPIYQRLHIEQRWDVIPGAESRDTFHGRLMRGLSRIHERHRDTLVVAVVHGGVIAHILAHATGARPFSFSGANNGSISHIVMMGEQILVRGFNDSAHLAPHFNATAPHMT
jgi:probable phosphoglycerate mutase